MGKFPRSHIFHLAVFFYYFFKCLFHNGSFKRFFNLLHSLTFRLSVIMTWRFITNLTHFFRWNIDLTFCCQINANIFSLVLVLFNCCLQFEYLYTHNFYSHIKNSTKRILWDENNVVPALLSIKIAHLWDEHILLRRTSFSPIFERKWMKCEGTPGTKTKIVNNIIIHFDELRFTDWISILFPFCCRYHGPMVS